MSVTITIQVKDAASAKSALLAKYGTLRQASRAMTEKFGYIDYDRMARTLKGKERHADSVEAICKELGVKPEIFEGAAK